MDLSQFDYEAARFWMGFLQLAGLVVLGVYTHLTNKSKANSSAIETVREDLQTEHQNLQDDQDNLKDRLALCERRQDFLEGQQAHAPTHGDLSKMHDRLNEFSEGLHGARGEMVTLSRQLSMVNQYLLNNKGDQGS